MLLVFLTLHKPPSAYHDICKYLMNCLLSYAFTKTPSVVYQNFLKEFWCTTIAYDPNPPTNDSEARPLKEYMIKFSEMNGKNPLVLVYKTFIESTGNDYGKDSYVSHPATKEVKAELAKIVENLILLDKTPVLKTAFPVAWRIVFTFVVQRKKPKSKISPSETKVSPTPSQRRVLSYSTQSPRETVPGPQDPERNIQLAEEEREVSDCDSNLTPVIGPEAPRLLPQKRKKPKSKISPSETKVSPTLSQRRVLSYPTQSPRETIPDPQDPERNIQLAVIDEESDATISDLERLDNIKKMLCDVLKGSNVNFIYDNTMRLVLYCRKFLTLSPLEISIPDVATSSESNGVDNTIDVGIKIGFTVIGKNEWGKFIKEVGLVLKSLWKNSQFDYVVKNSNGNSGGIVAIWNNTLFTLPSSLEGDGFLAIVGNWKFLTLSPSKISILDVATSSESNGVDNTIDMGIEIGFTVTGKSKDIQNILAKGEYIVDQ
nr:cytochrome P450 [Tanacetum cinerariifolium]